MWVPPQAPILPNNPHLPPNVIDTIIGPRHVRLDPRNVGTVYVSAFNNGIYRSAPSLEGGDASFKQVFTVLVHASAISALQQLFTGPVNYFRGAVTSATNLTALLPMFEPTSFIGRVLAMTDLFLIWYLLVLAIGLGVLYRRKTQPIAITLYGIYAVGVLVLAAVMSRWGGA